MTKQYEFKRAIKKYQKGSKHTKVMISFRVGSTMYAVFDTKLSSAVRELQQLTRGRQYSVDIKGHMFIGGEPVTGSVERYPTKEIYQADIVGPKGLAI